MKNSSMRYAGYAIEAFALGAIAWATIFGSIWWPMANAVVFGLLAAAFCLWAGLRLFASENAPATMNQPSNSDMTRPGAAKLRWLWVAFVGLFACVVLQVIPLPVTLVEFLSPTRAAQAELFSAALPELKTDSLTLAVNPANTRSSLALITIVIMAFIIGRYLASSRRRARRCIFVLIVLVLAEALYGLGEQLSGHQYILGLPIGSENASGTFYNRNHFAATLALMLPVTIGWFYYRAAQEKSALEQNRLLPATSWDVLSTKQGLWLLAPAILAVGIIQSHSRGGFSSMLLGLSLMFIIGARSRAVKAFSTIGLLLALTIFTYAMQSDYQVVLDRFGELTAQMDSGYSRLADWKNSMGMVRDYPVFGIGLGNFADVYLQYSNVDNARGYPYYAHNEWLEGLLTLGFLGMGFVMVIIAGLFIKSFKILCQAEEDQPWLLGCWCGLLGLALHSFAEGNLQILSILMTTSLMAGLLIGYRVRERSPEAIPA